MVDFEIPVEEKIIKFGNHIRANKRTILSSKFGDGKSYLLNKIRNDKDLNKDFVFLTIYPVNYQVAGNRDIFELIKRDLLFQLLKNGMVSDSIELTESEMFSWYIYNNGVSLIKDLIKFLPEIGSEADESLALIAAVKGLHLFRKFKVDFDKFVMRLKGVEDSDVVDRFLGEFENNGIYECDVITSIIQKSIKSFKKENQKDVVLVVEDLDRLDPAHLFRILNVLSANIDYSYKCFVKPDESLVGNKFDLDNIILVIDYANLKSIYHHFYGENTDFTGYISKFLSSVPFYYSLKEEKINNTLKQISMLTSLPSSILVNLLPIDDLMSSTVREIVQSFEIEKQIEHPAVRINGCVVNIDVSLLKVAAIMKRLKWEEERIVSAFTDLWRSEGETFVKYVLPFIFLDDREDRGSNTRFIYVADEASQIIYRMRIYLNDAGMCVRSGLLTTSTDKVSDDMSLYVRKMLEYLK